PGPPAPGDDEDAGAPAPGDLDHPPLPGRARVPRRGDAAPHEEHPRGRARLPRPVAPVAGQLLRAAAVAAAVEAAPDGGRAGPLLPDRPLLPRRETACRPGPRVQAARSRDVVRDRGG